MQALLYHKEYRFRMMGDLTDRLVLDVGCGDGQNAVLLAEMGARVVGVDISAKAIELARHRAELSGLSDKCRFICSPLETAGDMGGPFDIVWGDAILHHLISELDTVMECLISYTRDGGLHVYSEPVNFCHTLRSIRHMVPVQTEVTPDERPLEVAEIDILKSFLPDLKIAPFHLLGRLHRFLLNRGYYENSSPMRRCDSRGVALADKLLFMFPGVNRLADNAVLYGHVKSSKRNSNGNP